MQCVAMTDEPAYVEPMAPQALMSADELLHLNLPGKRAELVRGVLVVREPAGARHGRIAADVAWRLRTHVEGTDFGDVYAAETGFTLARDPDTVRAPDVAFVRKERLPTPEPSGFPDFAPDLAVEVLSPGDRPGEVLSKVADWLTAGTRLVWVIDPERRIARVFRADGSEASITQGQGLDGEDVIPGFVLELDPLFR